ncbi:MAG: hypothetical protein RR444_12125 [Oscillospiraceae bacterium]
MRAEELGNYLLGDLAELSDISPNLAYGAATVDNWGSEKKGEIYDKYFQKMGYDDAQAYRRKR